MSTTRHLPGDLLGVVLAAGQERVRHVEHIGARRGRTAPWPAWVDASLIDALARTGVTAPWEHQSRAADLAHRGENVVLSTGTASGKSLAYLLPVLADLRSGYCRDPRSAEPPATRSTTTLTASSAATPSSPTTLTSTARSPSAGTSTNLTRPVTALYLAPTKALAADQLSAIRALGLAGPRVATYDGDTPADERRWVREHAQYVLTNPDLLHHAMLPGHQRWDRFFRGLQYVVVDECHHYRGLFGSHVSAVLRRLRRVAARHGADPVFILASATVSNPAAHARRLTGLDVVEVTDDASPHGATDVVLWEPPLLPGGGEADAPTRRSAFAECADLVTDLTVAGAQTLTFVRSRRGAETLTSMSRRLLAEVDPDLSRRVAAYRGGYLPEERRALEQGLRSGDLRAVATTSALELGMDVTGLDAVLLAGWPGRRASLWQQIGRSGRGTQDAVAVLVATDDPLDTYLVHHPEAIFGPAVEETVLDPDNPYVLAPHLAAAAAELPLTPADEDVFGSTMPALLDALVEHGILRRRPAGWFWARRDRAGDHVDLRGSGGAPYRVVEASTGRVLGTVDASGADRTVHPGAVYVHQGATFLVRDLDRVDRLALVDRADPDWTTQARSTTDVRLVRTLQTQTWGPLEAAFGAVEVTSQVTSFLRRRLISGEVLGEERLDLPSQTLKTKAVWWTVPTSILDAAGISSTDLPGALHAAEHAAIGLFPLVATCDRWDVGGVSTAMHPDTGLPTIVVHDGHPGGAGFAERGFGAVRTWWRATLDAVAACECPDGCPSCVQSPKCGNGNYPLDKAGARLLLAVLLRLSEQEAIAVTLQPPSP